MLATSERLQMTRQWFHRLSTPVGDFRWSSRYRLTPGPATALDLGVLRGAAPKLALLLCPTAKKARPAGQKALGTTETTLGGTPIEKVKNRDIQDAVPHKGQKKKAGRSMHPAFTFQITPLYRSHRSHQNRLLLHHHQKKYPPPDDPQEPNLNPSTLHPETR